LRPKEKEKRNWAGGAFRTIELTPFVAQDIGIIGNPNQTGNGGRLNPAPASCLEPSKITLNRLKTIH